MTPRYPRYDVLVTLPGETQERLARQLYRIDAVINLIRFYTNHYPDWTVRVWDRAQGKNVTVVP